MWGGREGAQVDKEHDKIQDEDTTAYRGHELIGWPHDSSSTLCDLQADAKKLPHKEFL